jgi:hypothetical protein
LGGIGPSPLNQFVSSTWVQVQQVISKYANWSLWLIFICELWNDILCSCCYADQITTHSEPSQNHIVWMHWTINGTTDSFNSLHIIIGPINDVKMFQWIFVADLDHDMPCLWQCRSLLLLMLMFRYRVGYSYVSSTVWRAIARAHCGLPR